MKTNLTYKTASRELSDIVDDIQEGNVPVDSLISKIKRATELIKFCQAQLKNTEAEVSKILPKKSK